MLSHPFRLAFLMALVGSSAVLACVGDSPVAPPPDASSVDTGSPGKDASSNDATSGVDGSIDAGPCSNAVPGNVLTLPTSGSTPVFPNGGPLLAGDYVLTNVGAGCVPPCTVKGGNITGGLHVSVSGGTYTVERQISIQIVGQAQKVTLDRWSGTFDQINGKLAATSVCPTPNQTNTWSAFLPVGADGGTYNLIVRFEGEYLAQRADAGDSGSPVQYVFTFAKK